jgi:hypothetical protein
MTITADDFKYPGIGDYVRFTDGWADSGNDIGKIINRYFAGNDFVVIICVDALINHCIKRKLLEVEKLSDSEALLWKLENA